VVGHTSASTVDDSLCSGRMKSAGEQMKKSQPAR
jgi:hypothetical protein